MSSRSAVFPVPSSIRALLVALLAVGAFAFAAPARAHAAACTPAGPPVPGAPLPGSCFEGYDGDQVDSDGNGAGNDRLDWQTVISSGLADTVSGNKDTQFGPGGSEETPDSWTFDFGSLGSDKYDVVSAWSSVEQDTNDLMLALAFVRASNNGTTHLAFELNQLAPGYRMATETHGGSVVKVPTRSPGDLLITYSVDPPVLGFCKWSGDEHAGHWLDFAGNQAAGSNCPPLPAGLVEAAMNASPITAANNFLGSGALESKTFAEASINLTEAVKILTGNADGPDPCVNFGYMWVHSRSSISITSNQQDYILPENPANIANCSVSGTKWEDVNGNGLRDAGDDGLAGWTFFVDYDNDGVLDDGEPSAVSGADGSYKITGLKDGTWNVREVGQPDWICTSPNVPDAGPGTDPPACAYRVTMTGGDIGGLDFGNLHIDAQIDVEKTPDVTFAYVGDTITYTFVVTNPGNVPLAVTLDDSKCDAPATLQGGDADGDGKLDVSETWTYRCTHVVTAADGDPVHNVVTVTGDDGFGHKPTDSDEADVDVLHPAIAIDKTGPPTAEAGTAVSYTLAVTNPGDVAIVGATLSVTDPLCSAAPALQAKFTGDGPDASPATLDPGDRWIYTCSVQTTLGQTSILNVGHVAGKDVNGRSVSDDDDAPTTLDQVVVEPEQVVSGRARLAGPSACVSNVFKVRVRGRQIEKVVFKIDGKTVKTFRSRTGTGKRFVLRVNPSGYGTGTHRLRARIIFSASSETKPRTLRLSFERCKVAPVKPRFTG